MKKLSATLLASLFVLSLFSAPTHSASSVVMIDDCSCQSPDGSCSAGVSCSGGCTQFCGNNDNCTASCSGRHGFLGMEVTFEMQNGTYPQLVSELARISGKEIAFSPTKPNMVFNAGFKRATLWDALKLLSDQGTVSIAGQDFEKLKRLRRSLLSGERFSCCVTNTPVNTFVNDMIGLTGLELRIAGGRPMAAVNIKLQDANLTDILSAVSEQTGIKIIREDTDLDAR